MTHHSGLSDGAGFFCGMQIPLEWFRAVASGIAFPFTVREWTEKRGWCEQWQSHWVSHNFWLCSVESRDKAVRVEGEIFRCLESCERGWVDGSSSSDVVSHCLRMGFPLLDCVHGRHMVHSVCFRRHSFCHLAYVHAHIILRTSSVDEVSHPSCCGFHFCYNFDMSRVI